MPGKKSKPDPVGDQAVEDDPLFNEAVRLVRDEGRASVSFLQRRLHIGHSRAAKIMSAMEKKRILGPPEGPSQYHPVIGLEDRKPQETKLTAGMVTADGEQLFEDAVKTIREEGRASASLLQRRLRIGYPRASQLMELLEKRGIIGPREETSLYHAVLAPEDGKPWKDN